MNSSNIRLQAMRAATAVLFIWVLLLAPTQAGEVPCAYKKAPQELGELLVNMLCLTRDSTRTDKGFFIDDEKLWELTSGQRFFRSYPLRPGIEETYVQYFPHKMDPSSADWLYRLGIAFHKSHDPFDIHIEMRMPTYGPNFAEIERVFGKDWNSLGPLWVESPHWVPPPKATGPHGNDRIEYHFVLEQDVPGKIFIGFNYQGFANEININVGESAKPKNQRIEFIAPTVPHGGAGGRR